MLGCYWTCSVWPKWDRVVDSAWPCGANRFTREKDSKVKHNLNKKGMMFCWINTEISPQHDSNIKMCLQHLQQLILSCVRKRLACNYCRGIRNVSLRSYSLILHVSTPSTFRRSACVCWQSEKWLSDNVELLDLLKCQESSVCSPFSSWLCLSEHSREKF